MRFHLLAPFIISTAASAANINTPEAINLAIESRAPGTLNTQEIAQLTKAANALGHSTGYYRNGCQSRAHIFWSSLPDNIRSRVGKIWLFQPSAASYFNKFEPIRTSKDSAVTWGFHVALSFRDAKGTELVLDLALGAAPVTNQQWFDSFSVPDGSWTLQTTGEYYSFNAMNNVVTGFYKYVGDSLSNSWALEDAAFDAVGARLVSNPSECPTLAQHASEAIACKTALASVDFSAEHSAPGCESLRVLYRAECARIEKLLPGWAKSPGKTRCGVTLK